MMKNQKNVDRKRGEFGGKQFEIFRKLQILEWLGIEPTTPALLRVNPASLHRAWC